MAIKHIERLDATIKASAVAIDGVNSNGIVSPAFLQSAAQPIIDAFDDSDAAQLAYENLQARTGAITAINVDKGVSFKLFRAVIGIVLDEFNLHAAKINAILTAIDNGTTLAQVKTNIAAIADHPTRTQQQLITAIENKLNSGTVD